MNRKPAQQPDPATNWVQVPGAAKGIERNGRGEMRNVAPAPPPK